MESPFAATLRLESFPSYLSRSLAALFFASLVYYECPLLQEIAFNLQKKNSVMAGGGGKRSRKLQKAMKPVRDGFCKERQEKKLMGDIKKAAKDGQMDAAKIMAKDLVRTRAYIKKMHKMKSHMEAVSLRLQTMSSSQQAPAGHLVTRRSLHVVLHEAA